MLYSKKCLIFCSHFFKAAHASVHEVTYRLVVNAHNLANIIIFALFYIK